MIENLKKNKTTCNFTILHAEAMNEKNHIVILLLTAYRWVNARKT